MAKKQTGSNAAGTAFEDYIRTKLDEPRPRDPGELAPQLLEVVEICRAAIPRLEAEYFRTGNPVHVWNAISHAWTLANTLKQPLELPTWVLAYLIMSATEIMGSAVSFEAGDRHKPPDSPPPKNGVTSQYSDFFAGLTAEQRIDRVLEALRFRPGQGQNPAYEAYRDGTPEIQKREHDRKEKVEAVQRLRTTQGLTLNDALEAAGYKGQNGRRQYYRDKDKICDTA